MFFILVLLFTCVPVMELYFLVQASGHIGFFNTVFIVILTGVIGAALAKSQGLSLLSEVQKKTQSGQLPTDTLVEGLLVFGGGLLLLTPGFFTDALGFSMVLPWTRKVYREILKRYFKAKVRQGSVKFYSANSGFGTTYSSSENEKTSESFSSDVFNVESDFSPNSQMKTAKVIEVRDVTDSNPDENSGSQSKD